MRPREVKLSPAKRRLDAGRHGASRKRTGREQSSRFAVEPAAKAGWQVCDEEELLTPARAATLANRSVRTIRRAYRDLRRWMLARSAAAQPDEQQQPAPPLERLDMSAKVVQPKDSENLALLRAARARQRHDGARGGGAPPRAGDSVARRA
jgi:hypothetical protein